MKLGIDIGTSMTKAVILDGNEVAWMYITPTNANPSVAIEAVKAALADEKGLSLDSFDARGASGWGAKAAGEEWEHVETVLAMSAAGHWYNPDARCVMMCGAQESIVVNLDAKGNTVSYARNDKCASGAGRFLDIICEPLECEVPQMEEMARRSQKKLEMSAQCAVFAESEVVSRINDGECADDIASAVLDTVARNVASLCKKLTTKPQYVAGGGLLSNGVVVERIAKFLNIELDQFAPDPQYLVAVGAALSAKGGAA